MVLVVQCSVIGLFLCLTSLLVMYQQTQTINQHSLWSSLSVFSTGEEMTLLLVTNHHRDSSFEEYWKNHLKFRIMNLKLFIYHSKRISFINKRKVYSACHFILSLPVFLPFIGWGNYEILWDDDFWFHWGSWLRIINMLVILLIYLVQFCYYSILIYL